MLYFSSSAWTNPKRSSEQEGAESDAWKEVCQETKLEGMRSAVENKYPDVQFILNAVAGSLVVVTAKEDDNFELLEKGEWTVVSPKDSVLAKIHEAKAYVFSDLTVFGKQLDVEGFS